MQKARNIAEDASPEPCRQSHSIATACGATVTGRFLSPLLVLPGAVLEARFPGDRPQFAAAMALRDQAAKMSAQTPPNSPQKPQNNSRFSVCIPVKPN
jgi:hypothetical protein